MGHARSSSPFQFKLLDAVVVLVPAVQFVEFNVVGRLFLGEMLLAALFPVLIIKRGRLLVAPLPRTAIALGLFWLVGQMLTDVIRATPFEDFARGWAKIGFFLVNFMAIYLLVVGSRRRIVLFVLGLVLGGFLTYQFDPGIYAVGDPWKFGVGTSVTMLLILLAVMVQWRRSRHVLVAAGIVLFASALNIYMGYRSFGGICFVTGAFMLLQGWMTQGGRRQIAIGPGQAIAVGITGLVAASLALAAYSSMAGSGLLGSTAQAKYEMQTRGTFGVLLAGRPSILTSAKAVMDSPIVGHGSWAKNRDYAVEHYRSLQLLDVPVDDTMLSTLLIPSHSYVMGAWVEAGIMGAIFWLWVLWQAARRLLGLAGNRELLSPLLIFIIVNLTWSVLFSPFGAYGRLTAAFFLASLFTVFTPTILIRKPVEKRGRIVRGFS